MLPCGGSIKMKLRVASLINDSIVDGPGFRYAVYVQGCSHHCKGCHNPQTHDFNGGFEADTEKIWQEIKENPLLSGITFSGGDPLFQPVPLLELAKKAKANGFSVWCYTGWTLEQLIEKNDPEIIRLLHYVDVLVDGRFEQDQKTMDLPFRGSKNQRLIDLPAYFEEGIIREIELNQ